MEYRKMDEPERLSELPRFKGLLVPYVTLIDDKGIPQFKMTDPEKIWEIKRDKKCAVCGKPLDYWIAFMVTEEEANTRLVYENPNHEECLRYSFNVCPWLYYDKSTYSGIDEVEVDGFKINVAHPSRDETNKRPEKMGIYITNNYKNIILPSRFRVCKVGNVKRLEWIEGK